MLSPMHCCLVSFPYRRQQPSLFPLLVTPSKRYYMECNNICRWSGVNEGTWVETGKHSMEHGPSLAREGGVIEKERQGEKA